MEKYEELVEALRKATLDIVVDAAKACYEKTVQTCEEDFATLHANLDDLYNEYVDSSSWAGCTQLMYDEKLETQNAKKAAMFKSLISNDAIGYEQALDGYYKAKEDVKAMYESLNEELGMLDASRHRLLSVIEESIKCIKADQQLMQDEKARMQSVYENNMATNKDDFACEKFNEIYKYSMLSYNRNLEYINNCLRICSEYIRKLERQGALVVVENQTNGAEMGDE